MESPADAPTSAGAERGSDVSRRRLLAFGVPAIIAVAAAGSAPALLARGTRRSGAVDTTARGTLPATPSDEVFTAADASVDNVPILPGSTTTTTTTSTTPLASTPSSPTTAVTTTTTTVTTPTTAPTSVAATRSSSLPRPIPPPSDPRGFEEQVLLGAIRIPSLGVEAPLLEGIRLTTLDNGPGHWPGSAMPGEVGNVVVAAHRTSHGGPFRHIDQLVEGEAVVFVTDAGESRYEVTGTQVVHPDALWITDPTDDPTATLFACHPPGSVAQRIVVKLELAA